MVLECAGAVEERDRGSVLELDRYDLRAYSELRSQAAGLRKCEEAGRPRLETFPELLRDVWAGLFKFAPELRSEVPKSLALNRRVIEEAQKLPAWQELREATRLDEWASALGAISLSDAVLGLVPEEERQKVAEAARMEDELERFLQQAEAFSDLARAAEEAGDPGRANDFRLRAEAARAEARKAEERLAGLPVPQLPKGFRKEAGRALREAADDLEGAERFAFSWGLDPGQAQRVDKREKFELARRLRSDPKLRQIADLAGRMRNIAAAKQRERTKYVPSEVVGVTQGNDLSRVLPSELVRLTVPGLQPFFLRDFLEGKLLQYELKGREKEDRGPLVVCLDSSGSMAEGRRPYTKEVWAKAVLLALFWIAACQKRAFACIHFGSKSEIRVFEFPDPRSARPGDVAEMAAFFFGGGTDFETPLRKAQKLLEESEYRKGDVIFITDGQAAVSDQFLRQFRAAKARKGFAVWTVLVDVFTSVVERFSDGVERVDGLDDRGALDMALSV
ncbi:MAG: VWA domain-containing protein [Bacillota bacterium]